MYLSFLGTNVLNFLQHHRLKLLGDKQFFLVMGDSLGDAEMVPRLENSKESESKSESIKASESIKGTLRVGLLNYRITDENRKKYGETFDVVDEGDGDAHRWVEFLEKVPV